MVLFDVSHVWAVIREDKESTAKADIEGCIVAEGYVMISE
jgi:hypothetical protein